MKAKVRVFLGRALKAPPCVVRQCELTSRTDSRAADGQPGSDQTTDGQPGSSWAADGHVGSGRVVDVRVGGARAADAHAFSGRELQTCMWAAVELGIDSIGDVYGKNMAADAALAVDAAEVQEVTWLTM